MNITHSLIEVLPGVYVEPSDVQSVRDTLVFDKTWQHFVVVELRKPEGTEQVRKFCKDYAEVTLLIEKAVNAINTELRQRRLESKS